MSLWLNWLKIVLKLRPAFKRMRTFLWFVLCLFGFTIRQDIKGVTSIIRALGLKQVFYDRILDFFHSRAVMLDHLYKLWSHLILNSIPDSLIPKINGRIILIGDGIKVAKSGRKMPAVKKLHQNSTNNNKPEFIFGHSLQAIALLVGCGKSFFALPLTSKIHEGLVFSNRESRSLLDKMIRLLRSLSISVPYYIVLDAYYASRRIVNGLLEDGNHIVTQVRKNVIAYFPAPKTSEIRRGRKKRYGNKIKLKTLFEDISNFIEANSPASNERDVKIKYRCVDLVWRPIGILVRFVLVIHPVHGQKIFMTTDLSLKPLDVIRIYGFRFKIEVSFKQSIYTIGTYSYHFWMSMMTPRSSKSGDQYLHRKEKDYRERIRRKMQAYHCHIQLGIIAQGLLQYISLTCTKEVFSSFGSWFRTIRDGIYPSEQIVALAMRNSLPEFLVNSPQDETLVKFIKERIDLERQEGLRLLAA